MSGSVYIKNGTEIYEENPYITILQDSNTTPEDISVIFFYNTHCGACHTAMAYLDEYQKANPDVEISYYDLFNNTGTRELFEGFKSEYNRQYVSVPVIFMGNAVLEGNEAIRSNLDHLIKGYNELNANGSRHTIVPANTTPSAKETESFNIPLILKAGLLDGINPCAITGLVILLIYLLSLGSRQKMILAGIVYSAALVFLFFLSGTGLIMIIRTAELVKGFLFVAGILTIITGILLIKDTIYPERGPSLAIPEKRDGTIQKLIEKASILLAFVLGILIGIFEILCTGGVFHAIISMISLRTDIGTGLGYLLIYTIAFILPLLVIIALVAWGLSPERVNEFRIEQKRVIRIIIGCIMFFFAAIILMEIF
ncbi:MAG: cytochrome c biogenesis protein CcdA [Methanomicrobiales archaeon]|nr:cytochrome c biogenesis protein CcdA [Methanomicrobiales archaeon]